MKDRYIIFARHEAIKKASIPRNILKTYSVKIKNGKAVITKKKGIA